MSHEAKEKLVPNNTPEHHLTMERQDTLRNAWEAVRAAQSAMKAHNERRRELLESVATDTNLFGRYGGVAAPTAHEVNKAETVRGLAYGDSLGGLTAPATTELEKAYLDDFAATTTTEPATRELDQLRTKIAAEAVPGNELKEFTDQQFSTFA